MTRFQQVADEDVNPMPDGPEVEAKAVALLSRSALTGRWKVRGQ